MSIGLQKSLDKVIQRSVSSNKQVSNLRQSLRIVDKNVPKQLPQNLSLLPEGLKKHQGLLQLSHGNLNQPTQRYKINEIINSRI